MGPNFREFHELWVSFSDSTLTVNCKNISTKCSQGSFHKNLSAHMTFQGICVGPPRQGIIMMLMQNSLLMLAAMFQEILDNCWQ